MIRFVQTRGHAYTIEALQRLRGAPRLQIVDYDRLIRSRRLPRLPHVFTDLDRLAPSDLELAARIHHRLAARGIPVYNDPARVKTRFALLRALHAAGVNDFNAYRIDEGLRPVRYPVFLRRESGHGNPRSDLLPDWDAARTAIDAALDDGIPAINLILVEYAAEPVREGLFRKLALYRIGETYLPSVSVHDHHWIVKQGTLGAGGDALYREDLLRMRENPYADALAKAFEIAGIEYGRADFGLVGGRPQVYEINTNPSIHGPLDHPSKLRVQAHAESLRGLSQALHAIDVPRRGWRGVRVRDSRLARHQGWRLRGPRTRRAP